MSNTSNNNLFMQNPQSKPFSYQDKAQSTGNSDSTQQKYLIHDLGKILYYKIFPRAILSLEEINHLKTTFLLIIAAEETQ